MSDVNEDKRYDYLKDALAEIAYSQEPLARAIMWTLEDMYPGFQAGVMANFNELIDARLDKLTKENIASSNVRIESAPES